MQLHTFTSFPASALLLNPKTPRASEGELSLSLLRWILGTACSGTWQRGSQDAELREFQDPFLPLSEHRDSHSTFCSAQTLGNGSPNPGATQASACQGPAPRAGGDLDGDFGVSSSYRRWVLNPSECEQEPSPHRQSRPASSGENPCFPKPPCLAALQETALPQNHCPTPGHPPCLPVLGAGGIQPG